MRDDDVREDEVGCPCQTELTRATGAIQCTPRYVVNARLEERDGQHKRATDLPHLESELRRRLFLAVGIFVVVVPSLGTLSDLFFLLLESPDVPVSVGLGEQAEGHPY